MSRRAIFTASADTADGPSHDRGARESSEPLVRLAVRGDRGSERQIEAVVDTGYTGWLTLPRAIITELGLPWRTVGRGILADGSVSVFDVYQGKVLWDGRVRPVFVDEFDATPLVGMALLRGFELRMQVRYRGKVTIERLS